jgi:hypothetical protein
MSPDPLAVALRLPGAQEGLACAGTALEARTAVVRGKAFLFVAPDHLRLKLAAALPEAAGLAAAQPRVVQVGGQGWVKVAGELPAGVLERWITESHALFAERRRR